MKLIRLKHEMDDKYRIMPLNKAFIEALSLSDGRANEMEEFESNLLKQISSYETKEDIEFFLSIIKDEYKETVIKGWGYKMDYHTWIEKIDIIKTFKRKYPSTVDAHFLVSIVSNIHRDETDIEDGDILDRIYSYSDYSYVLCDVSLDDIEYDAYDIDEDLVEEYIWDESGDIPPIILEMPLSHEGEILDKFPLIDGAHRCTKLKQMGIKTVRAYVPMPQID